MLLREGVASSCSVGGLQHGRSGGCGGDCPGGVRQGSSTLGQSASAGLPGWLGAPRGPQPHAVSNEKTWLRAQGTTATRQSRNSSKRRSRCLGANSTSTTYGAALERGTSCSPSSLSHRLLGRRSWINAWDQCRGRAESICACCAKAAGHRGSMRIRGTEGWT